ncbi:MAG: relaxase domain-containing protein [Alphaproteobacteria bacterium]|nr:relaxase domain-containing protein [Alphaproteobacteria bacterium]
MLSIFAINTPEGMATYYDSDGYYAKGDPEAQAASQWHGKGAAAAGLEGFVTPEVFQRVLDGNTPDGRWLGRMVDGEWKHRAGIDLTFSAPKSVSVMALVAGDDRLIAAHDQAVRAVLDHIEARVLETRVWDPKLGAQVKERDLDMVAALFRHEVNRNKDPHLHSHGVVANMVRPGDGKWRSIEGESLFDHKMEMGARYRTELAMNVRELGYEIERTHLDGRFDVTGVPKSILDAFSTRSQEIREALEGYEVQTAKTAALATLMTRNHKSVVDRDSLHREWRERGDRLGLNTPIPAPEPVVGDPVAGDAAKQARLTTEVVAAEAVDYAIRHLSERSSTFSLSELRTVANGYGVGHFRPRALDRAVDADKRLIPSRHPEQAGLDFVTTADAVATERETIQAMREAQDGVRPFMAFAEINRGLEGMSADGGALNDGQKNAVRALLSGRDRIIGVQGYAGVGKTTLLKAARELAESRGYEVLGLAPSASAAKTLGDEAGIEAQTLQKFLGRFAGYAQGRGTEEGRKRVRETFKNTLIVLDESSLAGAAQMRDLFRIAGEILPARLVLVGDAKQLDAVEAGKPFAQLQAHGMKTVKVGEIVRQRNPELKAAVHAAIAGDIRAAFARIDGNILEADAPDEPDTGAVSRAEGEPSPRDLALAGKAFEAWNDLPRETRETAGIAAPTHAIRQAVNELVREQLDREGRLTGPALAVDALRSAGYTDAEKGRARNYFDDNKVIFNRDWKDFSQGEVLDVAGRDEQANTVALRKDGAGEITVLDLANRRTAQAVDVLHKGPLTLRRGDRIRFTRNDESLGLVNSAMADVAAIDRHGRVTLEKEDGGRLNLDPDSTALRFIDHAWASTVHAFQGRTVDTIIGVMHAEHPHLTHQKAFYVEISRARQDAFLVTDDRQKLGRKLTQETGERIAGLEAVGKDQQRPSPQAAPVKTVEAEIGG